MNHYIGTHAECEELQALLDEAHGPYPRPPTRIVGAKKRQLVTEWDGQGSPPFGWTQHHVAVREHPTNPVLFAVEIPPQDAGKENARLSPAQRGVLAARRAAAVVQLPAEWNPDDGGAAPASRGKAP